MTTPPGAMNRWLLRIFQTQVADQCHMVVMAFQGLALALADLSRITSTHIADLQMPAPGPAFDFEAAAYAMDRFFEAQRRNFDEQAEAMDRVWYSLKALVVAAANVSKALWGQGGSLSLQREPLRRSLRITDMSPLKVRTMRNHFEHYDERLDEWDAKTKQHAHIDRNLGDVARYSNPPPAKINVFRNFDPATWKLTFWGDEYDIRAIVAEAQRLGPIARAASLAMP